MFKSRKNIESLNELNILPNAVKETVKRHDFCSGSDYFFVRLPVKPNQGHRFRSTIRDDFLGNGTLC